jgi:hypothetical protein
MRTTSVRSPSVLPALSLAKYAILVAPSAEMTMVASAPATVCSAVCAPVSR